MADATSGLSAPRRLEFGQCGRCPYLAGGSPAFCYSCAHSTIEPLAEPDRRCVVCDQTYGEGDTECRNPVCGMSERWFDWNYAVALRKGTLEQAINAYKYSGASSGERGWAAIFGRILVGFLDAHESLFESADLLVASPTFARPGSRREWDHIREVLVAADAEQIPSGRWPFDLADPPAILKTSETPSMVSMKSYAARRMNAEGPVRDSLIVPDASRTEDRRIIVVDDVFTDGLTLREVARALRMQGRAAQVQGVTLARQPFRPH
jgi:predicted amidophosphoribosyltransferase